MDRIHQSVFATWYLLKILTRVVKEPYLIPSSTVSSNTFIIVSLNELGKDVTKWMRTWKTITWRDFTWRKTVFDIFCNSMTAATCCKSVSDPLTVWVINCRNPTIRPQELIYVAVSWSPHFLGLLLRNMTQSGIKSRLAEKIYVT